MGISTRISGKAGMAEAKQFLMTFPLQHPPARPTVVSTLAFDQWAERNGYYSTKCEPATRTARRNTLRERMNSAGTSMEWVLDGNDPFHIRVGRHGDHYLVEPAIKAYGAKTSQLPKKAASFTKTKRELTVRLLASVDRTALSPVDNVRLDAIEDYIENMMENVNFVFGLAARQIDKKLAELAKTIPSLPKKSSLTSQIDIDVAPGNEDEDEDEDKGGPVDPNLP